MTVRYADGGSSEKILGGVKMKLLAMRLMAEVEQ